MQPHGPTRPQKDQEHNKPQSQQSRVEARHETPRNTESEDERALRQRVKRRGCPTNFEFGSEIQRRYRTEVFFCAQATEARAPGQALLGVNVR